MNEIATRNDHGYMPTTLDEIGRIGKMLAESGYYPDARDVMKACAKVLAGAEIGIPPNAAMRGVHIMNGKTELSSALKAALVKRSGRYNYRIREQTEKACRIEWFEHGESVGESSFTIEEAERAGLLKSETYKKYPKAMLFARALSAGVMSHCPDVTLGATYSEGEVLPGGDERIPDGVDPVTGEIVEVFDAVEVHESDEFPAVVA